LRLAFGGRLIVALGLPGRKEYVVSEVIKVRAGLFGVLALLLLGAFSAAPAFAEGGPFCHHRAVGGEGEGELIKGQSPQGIEGKGGEQHLEGKIGGTAITLFSAGAQIKGSLYNNEDQCQAKLNIQYQTITFEKPKLPNCAVSIPNNNLLKLYGHAAWKWLGTEAEQKENPIRQGRDWILLPTELQQGAKELPKTETPFTVLNINSVGGTCILASAQVPVRGTVFAEANPATKEVFSAEEEQKALPNGTLQQFWNGAYPLIGAKSNLTLGTEEGKYTGAFKIKPITQKQTEPQEIGYFEK
jgi:hypothetical protein